MNSAESAVSAYGLEPTVSVYVLAALAFGFVSLFLQREQSLMSRYENRHSVALSWASTAIVQLTFFLGLLSFLTSLFAGFIASDITPDFLRPNDIAAVNTLFANLWLAAHLSLVAAGVFSVYWVAEARLSKTHAPPISYSESRSSRPEAL